MAIYFLNIKTFGRGSGSSAASAAAYRAGERIRDERTGRIYDHSERLDVLHKEIVLPGKFADDDMAWALDRANLWNAAEAAESRRNARVAREFLIALPFELSQPQRVGLVKGFSQELSDRYGFAVDIAIHAPRDFPGSDPRNVHAHLLTTTREVAIEGLGAKTTLDMNDSNRRQMGLGPVINELLHARERWAAAANQAMLEASIAARVDHRSLESQGIDREPRPRIPHAAFEMERHGYRSVVAERIRDEHQARVQARLDKAAERAKSPVLESTIAAAARSQSVEEVQREAVENWLRYRQSRAVEPQNAEDAQRKSVESWLRYRQSRGQDKTESLADSDRTPTKSHARDDDLGL